MKKVEDIFFSGTFGGETLSLASAKVIIDKYKKYNVVKYFEEVGTDLLMRLNQLIDDNDLNDVFWTSGHPSWIFLHIKEQKRYNVLEIKTFFMQEMLKRGILIIGSHNLSFSHSKKEIDQLLSTYTEVLPMIKRRIKANDLLENINGDVLKPTIKQDRFNEEYRIN